MLKAQDQIQNIEMTLRSLVSEQFLTKSSKLGFTKTLYLYTKLCNSFPDNVHLNVKRDFVLYHSQFVFCCLHGYHTVKSSL